MGRKAGLKGTGDSRPTAKGDRGNGARQKKRALKSKNHQREEQPKGGTDARRQISFLDSGKKKTLLKGRERGKRGKGRREHRGTQATDRNQGSRIKKT